MNVFLDLTFWLDHTEKRSRNKALKFLLSLCSWATLKPYRLWLNATFPEFKDPENVEVKEYAS